MTTPHVRFLTSVLALALVGWGLFAFILLVDGWHWGDLPLFAVFSVLFSYLSFGFCHAAFGLLHQRKKETIAATLPQENESKGKVALVMPVHDEPVERVMQGLEATFNSVLGEKDGQHFDLYILSDSIKVRKWVEEEEAWLRWLKRTGLKNRIFYRHRNSNEGRKAGNVADFCNEHGDRYDFMVVLDADSVMTGETLVALRERMMAEPQLGLLQTVPKLVGAQSFYGRLQQFANRVYGGLFLSGLSYWQGDGGNFWGHNAIIRLKAFKECCALPHLPGSGGFGGEILSHDFVEAGLLRSHGWGVRLAEDLHGSYEEGPQNLIDAAKRDRRWCEGNLQHVTFLLSKGPSQSHSHSSAQWHPRLSRFSALARPHCLELLPARNPHRTLSSECLLFCYPSRPHSPSSFSSQAPLPHQPRNAAARGQELWRPQENLRRRAFGVTHFYPPRSPQPGLPHPICCRRLVR